MVQVIIFDWGNVLFFYDKGAFLKKLSSFFGVSEACFKDNE